MEQSKKRGGFVMQAVILASAGILTRIIGLLYGVPLSRIIGDIGNGYYASAYNIYAIILLICSYSIPMAVSKIISAKLVLKEYNNAYRIFQCALIYVTVVGGIAALITFIFAPEIVDVVQAVPALRILAPTIFFSGLLSVFRGYMQAYNTMVPTSVSQIVEQVLNAIVSVGAAYILTRPYVNAEDPTELPMYGAAGGAMGTGVGVLAGLFVMLIVYAKRVQAIKETRLTDTKQPDSYARIFKMILFMVTPVILSTAIYNISTVLDQKVFYNLMSLRGALENDTSALYGIYARKYTVLVNVPIALASAVSSAMIPGISGAYEIGDKRAACGKVREAIRFTMLMSIPAATGMGVLAKPIMLLLFPGTPDIGWRLLNIGVVTVVFYGVSTVTNGVLQGIGKVNIPMRNAAAALVIHLVFLVPLLLVTDLKLYAIMAATVVYTVVICILNARAVKKYLGYQQEYMHTFVMPAVAAAVMGIVTWASYKVCYHVVRSNAFAMAVSVVLSVLVYFVALMKIGGFTEEQLASFPKGRLLVKAARKLHLLK